MDRVGLAEAYNAYGSKMLNVDLMFALGVPVPIYNTKTLHSIADIIMPVVCRLPFRMLYPTGNGQNITVERFKRYYNQADIIAGDFLYIKKHMPIYMSGKIVVTNTVTKEDIADLIERGVDLLITSTPALDGSSFGTNVLEAIVVCLSEKLPDELGLDGFREIV